MANLGASLVGQRSAADNLEFGDSDALAACADAVDRGAPVISKARAHREIYAQIEDLERSIVRERRIVESLNERIADSKPKMAASLKTERAREWRRQTLEAQLRRTQG